MKTKYLHQYYLVNEAITPCKEVEKDHAEIGGSVYEVIRVIQSVLLFYEDHYHRLKESALIAGINNIPGEASLKVQLNGLIVANNSPEGNIRIDLFKDGMVVARFIPHKYPTPDDYRNGVLLALFNAERENPNAKVARPQLRDAVNEFINQKKVYEALLVDREGYIAEGSRSNIFAINDNYIVTPPASQVLVGITRKKVFDTCVRKKIKILEQKLHVEEIHAFRGFFITGTSPKILPVRGIGNYFFDININLLRTLMSEYDRMIREYINDKNNQHHL